MYKLILNRMTQKIECVNKIENSTVVCIPFDPANTDYQQYLEWLAEGNEPEAADV